MPQKNQHDLSAFNCASLTPFLTRIALICPLQLEADALQISPQSPLVSTALQENGWVCGELLI